MTNDAIKNASRFLGFASDYEEARPQMPHYTIRLIKTYLKKKPERVVDLGCGTGLSTLVWENECDEAVGIEPSKDMLRVALKKQTHHITFKEAFSHETGLPDGFADAIVCSQSFHWMEPQSTLAEVNRILKPGGIFAAVDCDWPPVCGLNAEKAYTALFKAVDEIENSDPLLKNKFSKWDKNKHLQNIEKSGYFTFTREIVFSSTEKCTAARFIGLALSQGGLQNVLKNMPEAIATPLEKFRHTVLVEFGDSEFEIDFSYRLRIGIK